MVKFAELIFFMRSPHFTKSISILILTLIGGLSAFGQDSASPPVKCWEYPLEIQVNIDPASDNQQEIYLPSADGSIYALTSNGSLLWRTDELTTMRSHIRYYDTRIYLVTDTGPQNTDPSFLSISTKSGLTIWRTQLQDFNYGRGIISTPVVLNHQLIGLFTDIKPLYFFSLEDGALLKTQNQTLNDTIRTRSTQLTTDKLPTNGFPVEALDSEKYGQETIAIESEERTTFLFNDRYLLHTLNSGKISFHLGDTKNKIWSARIGGRVLSANLYNSSLLLSSADNYLYSLRITDGKLLWKRRFEGKIKSTVMPSKHLVISSVINGQRSILTDIETGRLVSAIASGGETSYVAKPLVINDTVMVFEQKRITAYSLGSCTK